MRIARLARHYALRPSEMVGGDLSEYDAFCVDEALAHRLEVASEAEPDDVTEDAAPADETLDEAMARMEAKPRRESKPPAGAKMLEMTEAAG